MIFVAITLNMKANENKGKTLFIDDYFDKIEPYINYLIYNCRIQGEWKI